MGKNKVVKRFDGYSTQYWVCPASVTKVRVSAYASINNVVSMNGGCSFYLTPWGTIASMGDGTGGGLGNNAVTSRSSPFAVVGSNTYRQVCSVNNGAIALNQYGTAYAWGLQGVGTYGHLGLGDLTPRSSPVAVVGGYKFRSISSSGYNAFGITYDGLLYAWGYNNYGAVGDGTVTMKSSPVAVVGGLIGVKMVSGSGSPLALDSNGDAYAWGRNNYGQLGVGGVIPRSSPVLVMADVKYIRSANQSNFFIDENDDLYACGNNNYGQLGVGDVTPRSSPVLVLGGLKWKSVHSYYEASLGITTDNVLYAWGRNLKGQLGLGDIVSRSSPVLVMANVVDCAISDVGSSLAISSGSTVYGWGSNFYGEAGLNDQVARSTPTAIVSPFIGKSMKKYLLSDQVFDVIPGNTYYVVLNDHAASFGGNSLYDVECVPMEVALEYEA